MYRGAPTLNPEAHARTPKGRLSLLVGVQGKEEICRGAKLFPDPPPQPGISGLGGSATGLFSLSHG